MYLKGAQTKYLSSKQLKINKTKRKLKKKHEKRNEKREKRTPDSWDTVDGHATRVIVILVGCAQARRALETWNVEWSAD